MKGNYEMIVNYLQDGVKNCNFGNKGILSLAGIKVTGHEILVTNNMVCIFNNCSGCLL